MPSGGPRHWQWECHGEKEPEVRVAQSNLKLGNTLPEHAADVHGAERRRGSEPADAPRARVAPQRRFLSGQRRRRNLYH